MNSEMMKNMKVSRKPIELFPTDEFEKVCEELGLLEPTINEINEDMWTLQQQTELNDRRW